MTMKQDSENNVVVLKPEEQKNLIQAFGQADTWLSKTYLPEIGFSEVVNVPATRANAEVLNMHIRFFEVGRVVLDASENPRDKLVSVFNAVGSAGAGLLVWVHGDKDRVTLRIGIKAPQADEVVAGTCGEILQRSLEGNFPGTEIRPVFGSEGLDRLLAETFDDKGTTLVSVTDIPGVRSEEESRERRFMQGVEKVMDAMRGREYSILWVADPVGIADLAANRRNLENMYSDLVPFSEAQLTLGKNEAATLGKSISKSVTNTMSKNVSDSVTHTRGTSKSKTTGKSESVCGSLIFVSTTSGTNESEMEGENESTAKGHVEGQGSAEAKGEAHAQSDSKTTGTSESWQRKFENHSIKELLKKIDRMLERYDKCADVGMWNCAAYVMAKNPADAETAASIYHSVVRGKNSSLEAGGVVAWDKARAKDALQCLRQMEHPLVKTPSGLEVTPGTLVSSAELAIAAGLPLRSLPGLPVLECARFGRTVSTFGGDEGAGGILLGNVWHMNHEEEAPVRLDRDSLVSHAFVTGSTGSGKSNTVCRMLSELKKDTVFLVVEPAKGEYRKVFGENGAAAVYGTDPREGPEALLRLNPFSFPGSLHIRSHLDRLAALFNVCWPMYAAMPAVLKDALEKAYEECGWDLVLSTNPYGQDLYPTFADVARWVRTTMDDSDYDAENKGAYKGSLVTRLGALANGVNALVFTDDELSGEELFERNAIVDLSQIGAGDTKALIMGILVLKLQEFRMAEGRMNAPLRHVTVLEEAHNLLRRSGGGGTSGDGEAGGGETLFAKSVEMLANAIAEMRTYGEGFIIADQSPGLLDLSAIRNTNTKIVLRLPDRGDRELVGRAMHLNDEQIAELARLPRGVAAVCQNEWIESVLCKVEKHEPEESRRHSAVPRRALGKGREMSDEDKMAIADCVLNGALLPRKWAEGRIPLSARSRVAIAKIRRGETSPSDPAVAGAVLAELFPQAVQWLRDAAKRAGDQDTWKREASRGLPGNIGREQLRDDIARFLNDWMESERPR